ncbi:unnamed protein product [Urochloa humidicola]
MHASTSKEKGRMAATVRKLVSRTLDKRRSGRSGCSRRGGAGGGAAGCFAVYVGAGRERFVVPVERANHPLFRRLLDDAELEYGYAAEGPIALPGCDVSAFLDVLWKMEHDDGEGVVVPAATMAAAAVVSLSPMCGLITRSGGGVNGYRTLNPKSRSSLRWWQ